MISSRPELRLDWCSHEAARYAVEHWHYSRSMPVGKLAKLGVWEADRFIGCVLFGRGSTGNIGAPYDLPQTAICELVRVALRQHVWPVSRIIRIAVRLLSVAMPGVKLIVSYADSEQGHHGGIYQAGGWVYVGGRRDRAYRLRGVLRHPKSLHSLYGYGGQALDWLRLHVDPAAEQVMMADKHKYLYPLDAGIRAQIAPLAQSYPKRAKQSSDAPAVQVGEGGAAPTGTLQEPH